MIQEKYNRRIYDEGTNEAILDLSHLRTNALEPVKITSEDSVLVFEPNSKAVVEWLQEKSKNVVVADGNTSISEGFDVIISLGKITETPKAMKEHLNAGGKIVYAFSEKSADIGFIKKLFKEAGMNKIETFRLLPDYLFTKEIYAEDTLQGGAGDYLLIAE